MFKKGYWKDYYSKRFMKGSFPRGTKMWDDFAERYNGFSALSTKFTQRQVNSMDLNPEFSLIDIGCGTGRLSIPIAKKVKSLTALDSSAPMLSFAGKNAEKEGLSNINFINLEWEEVKPGINVGHHDIAMASRSPAFRDIEKINEIASKKVYLLTFVESSLKEFHDELMHGIIEINSPDKNVSMPFHCLFFNLACEMGYNPEVRFIEDGFSRVYSGYDEAYEDFEWLHVPAAKKDILKGNLDNFLSPFENGKILLLKKTRTVIISWDKDVSL